MPPAFAAPPTTVTQYDAGLDCAGSTTTGETVRVSAYTSADFGAGAFVSVGPDDAPLLTAFSVEGGWQEDSISFVLAAFTDGGGGHREEAGSGRFAATTSVLDTVERTSRDGSGNQHVRATIVTASLAADATLALPGFVVDDLDCSGSSTTATYVSNRPASTVRFERRFFDRERCEGNAVVGLFGPEDGEYYLSVEVGEPNNQFHLFGVVDEPKGDLITAELPLRDSQTGELLGRYEVTASLAPAERTAKSVLQTATARITQHSTLLDVNARVSLPWMEVDATCQALEVVTRSVVRAANGPKPAQSTPSNDQPAGATPVSVGETARTTTRGAALLPEAPLTCATAPGRTVWYSFPGTGGPVALDTAGSDFDSALAVYRAGEGTLDEVACNDDVSRSYPYPPSTLQGRLELPTTAGSVYLVQVGGVFADYGRLVLSVRQSPEA